MKYFKRFSKILLLWSIVFLSACSSGTIYDKSIKVNQSGWYKNDMARFDLRINDSLETYDYFLNIRHTVDYRYSNLFVFFKTTYPNGNISRDTLEFVLANKSGKWYGKGWGDIKDISFPLVKSIKFPLRGEYTFQIQQAMRVDTLEGITDIGIRIERSK
ncbi:MAG: gliding motility lipoprotein GldH [Chlorobi bacterium]|nr:gliding motility lipoprotein GldH [Chlorobiota bacterium]